MVLVSLSRLPSKKSKDLKIVAIVDDDKNKQNTYLHGVKVVGTTEQIPEIVGIMKSKLEILCHSFVGSG